MLNGVLTTLKRINYLRAVTCQIINSNLPTNNKWSVWFKTLPEHLHTNPNKLTALDEIGDDGITRRRRQQLLIKDFNDKFPERYGFDNLKNLLQLRLDTYYTTYYDTCIKAQLIELCDWIDTSCDPFESRRRLIYTFYPIDSKLKTCFDSLRIHYREYEHAFTIDGWLIRLQPNNDYDQAHRVLLSNFYHSTTASNHSGV